MPPKPRPIPVTSRALVDLVLLGPTQDRRQLQDSPILGDVWLAFANAPVGPQDLLLSPYKSRAAGPVAARVSARVHELRDQPRRRGKGRTDGTAAARRKGGKAALLLPDDAPHVAYLQGLVAARLHFSEVLQILVPMTGWWRNKRVDEEVLEYETDERETERPEGPHRLHRAMGACGERRRSRSDRQEVRGVPHAGSLPVARGPDHMGRHERDEGARGHRRGHLPAQRPPADRGRPLLSVRGYQARRRGRSTRRQG